MKNIIQKHHTGFGILNLANGDVRVTVSIRPDETSFGVALILEQEFKKEVAITLCPELEKNSKLEIRRRERIRNLLNQCQLLFMNNGSDNDKLVFEALKESVREDITLAELESLKAENMPIFFNTTEPVEQQVLTSQSFQKHPLTFIVKINKDKDTRGRWYDNFEGTLTVRDYPDDFLNSRQILNEECPELFIVDNGEHHNKLILKNNCIVL